MSKQTPTQPPQPANSTPNLETSHPRHISTTKKIKKLAQFNQNISKNSKVIASKTVIQSKDYFLRLFNPKSNVSRPWAAMAANFLRTQLPNYRKVDFTLFNSQSEAVYICLTAEPCVKLESVRGEVVFGAIAVFKWDDFACIYGMAVNPLLLKMGFGQVLVQAAYDHFKCPMKTESDPTATGFYQRLGFTLCKEPYTKTVHPELQFQLDHPVSNVNVKARPLPFSLTIKEISAEWAAVKYCLEVIDKLDKQLKGEKSGPFLEARGVVISVIENLNPTTKSETAQFLRSKFREHGLDSLINIL